MNSNPCRPRSDATFCDVWSGLIRFAQIRLSTCSGKIRYLYVSVRYFLCCDHMLNTNQLARNELGILTTFVPEILLCSSPLDSWTSGLPSSSSSLKQTLCGAFQTQLHVCISVLLNPFSPADQKRYQCKSVDPGETTRLIRICTVCLFLILDYPSPFLHQWTCPNSRIDESTLERDERVLRTSITRWYLRIKRVNTYYFYNINDLPQCCKNQHTQTKQRGDIYTSGELIFTTSITSTISQNVVKTSVQRQYNAVIFTHPQNPYLPLL